MDDDELATSVQSENESVQLLCCCQQESDFDCHVYDHQVQYISSSLVRSCRILKAK